MVMRRRAFVAMAAAAGTSLVAPARDPARAQALAGRLAEVLASGDLAQPVLLCSPTLRPHVWRLFSRALPHIVRTKPSWTI